MVDNALTNEKSARHRGCLLKLILLGGAILTNRRTVQADFQEDLFRGQDGTAYQVLTFQKLVGEDAEKFRVTTVGGSVNGVGTCNLPGSLPNADVAAVAGAQIPLQSLHAFASVERTTVLTPAGLTPTFTVMNKCAGVLTLGSGATAINICRVASDCVGLPGATVTLFPLSASDASINAACVANGVNALCDGSTNRSAFAFGLPATANVCNTPGNVTVNSKICNPKPADGFDLIGNGTAIVFVYNSSLAGSGFTPGAAGFPLDSDDVNVPVCPVTGADKVLNAAGRVDTLNAPPGSPGMCTSNTPTVTVTPVVTSTRTNTPTSTPTPTHLVGVDLGRSAAQPGGIACISGQLRSGGMQIAGTGNDIGFDASRFAFGDCTINPAIGTGSAPDKQLLEFAVSPGLERVGIFGFSSAAIPDGTLYACSFSVAANVSPGSYALTNVASASDPQGNDLPNVGGAPGTIIVTTCTGDCNGDGRVSIGEVIKCVNMFLGEPFCNLPNPSLSCPVADANLNGGVSIGEVIQCANRFLMGCP